MADEQDDRRWPDWLHRKSHEPADFRMWYVTVAMNAMGRKGFRPIQRDRDLFWRMDTVDFWMERVLKP